MITNKLTISLYFLSSIILFSCSKNNDNKCLSYTNAPVTKVEGANSGLVNQQLSLKISFTCFNGCGQFGRIEQASNADTTTINIIAKSEGCVCTDVLLTKQTIYNFKATQAGIYYLKFWQTEKNYLIDTITIR
jgi:hypothetical protein